MSDRKDGGPAFPNITPDMNVDGGPGMSLRDWFAGQALAGMLGSTPVDDGDNWPVASNVAANAYRYADAMIAVRSK